MDTTSEGINRHRRRFLGAAAATVAAAQLGMIGSAAAQTGKTKAAQLPAVKPGTNTSFGTLKQIDAGVLNVGYAEAGPTDGPAGHSSARLALRHSHLCRCRPFAGVGGIPGDRPYLRGYGTTRFLSGETVRNGQQSALAVDIIALMDALKIEKAIVAGCDWGARTAGIMAALWPERCKALVSVSGYLIGSQ